jgi:hypothetical protein
LFFIGVAFSVVFPWCALSAFRISINMPIGY